MTAVETSDSCIIWLVSGDREEKSFRNDKVPRKRDDEDQLIEPCHDKQHHDSRKSVSSEIEVMMSRDERLFRDFYSQVKMIPMNKLTVEMIRDSPVHSVIVLYFPNTFQMDSGKVAIYSDWIRRMHYSTRSSILMTDDRLPNEQDLRGWFQVGIQNFLLRPLSREIIQTLGVISSIERDLMVRDKSPRGPKTFGSQDTLTSNVFPSNHISIGCGQSLAHRHEVFPMELKQFTETRKLDEKENGYEKKEEEEEEEELIDSKNLISSVSGEFAKNATKSVWLLEDFVRLAFPLNGENVSPVACLRRSSLPSLLMMSEDHAMRLSRGLNSWDFDVHAYSMEELTFLAWHMFVEMGAGTLEMIDLDALQRFLVAVRANYRDNPYHNFYHAIDVLQACYYMTKGNFRERMGIRSIDLLALAVAAYCHDVGHPGVNNLFMKKARTSLAILYNDRSILENYHCTVTFSLLKRSELNFLAKLNHEQCEEFRSLVINMILMTDMSLHGNFVQRWKHHFVSKNTDHPSPDHHRHHSTSGSLFKKSMTIKQEESERHLFLAGIMKSADISNPARPFPIAHRWAYQVLEEHHRQRDLERQIGCPLFSENHNSNSDPLGSICSQANFIRTTVLPFYEELHSNLVNLDEPITNLRKNYQVWRLAERTSGKRWSTPLPHTPFNSSSSRFAWQAKRRAHRRGGTHSRRLSLPTGSLETNRIFDEPHHHFPPIHQDHSRQDRQTEPLVTIELPSVSISLNTHSNFWQPHDLTKRRRSLPTDTRSQETCVSSDTFHSILS